ncbi:MAG: N-acetylglucosamine kinase [Micromonosporaceae bacterium]
MTTFLAVDGGNSKTEVLYADTTGAILGYARGPGSNHQTAGGLEIAIERIDALIRRATADRDTRRDIGRDTDGDAAEPPVLAQLCLAGADLPSEVAALERAVADANWAEKSIVDNDTMALLRAGTDAPDAVAVVCGSGTNCAGRTGDGRTYRFPALGRVSGDWGGGRELGEQALWHAARAEDGRGPATALQAAVAEHFGYAGVAEVSVAVHLREIPWRRLDELAPVLLQVAAAGDPVARSVVVRQADEVVALATAALRRLDLLGTAATVVLGGGVLRSRDPLLHREIRDRLRASAPGAETTVVNHPPVVGAALLALDVLGADAAAHARLRAAATRAATCAY